MMLRLNTALGVASGCVSNDRSSLNVPPASCVRSAFEGMLPACDLAPSGLEQTLDSVSSWPLGAYSRALQQFVRFLRTAGIRIAAFIQHVTPLRVFGA